MMPRNPHQSDLALTSAPHAVMQGTAHGNELADSLAGQGELQDRLRMYKEGIVKAILDRVLEDEEREWMNGVHVRRLMTLVQRNGAGRKSELHSRKRIINNI